MGPDRGRLSSAYQRLVALAEHELALVDAGRWTELPAAMDERIALAATLPLAPPADARDDLTRAAGLQKQIESRLRVGRSLAARELGELTRGRSAMRGYQATTAAQGGAVDGAA